MPTLAIGTAPLSGSTDEAPSSNPNYIGFFPERVTRSKLEYVTSIRHFYIAAKAILPMYYVNGSWRGKYLEKKSLSHQRLTILQQSVEEVTAKMHAHFEKCLVELGVGYVDLMLLHWPSAGGGVAKKSETTNKSVDNDNAKNKMVEINPNNRAKRFAAWKVLEHYYNMGWARSIGVSKFHEVHIQHLLDDGAQ
ncbi:hypothetical protein ACHAWC_001909, partial [Mediolabrus comicus]